MMSISTEGFEKPRSVSAGATPLLQWLPIADLLVDPAYQSPITGKGRRTVNRIAQAFSWASFAPVVVAPTEGGKYAIVDGHFRTTAAALVGFDSVPCQIVMASREQQALACKALNGTTAPVSRMGLHMAALSVGEDFAVRVADICARADVQLLHYPVPADRQCIGQTMAVGAIVRCLKRYGEDTLITALQCVTQTANNQPGALSARVIKALCAVLEADRPRRDSGLALFEAFDAIDLRELQNVATIDAVVKKVSHAQSLADQIRSKLVRLLPASKIAEANVRNVPKTPNGVAARKVRTYNAVQTSKGADTSQNRAS